MLWALRRASARARSSTRAARRPTATARTATTTTRRASRALTPLNPYGESKQQFDLWALARGARRPPRRRAGPASSSSTSTASASATRARWRASSCTRFDQIRAERRGAALQEPQRRHRRRRADARLRLRRGRRRRPALRARRRRSPRGIFNLGTGPARTFLDLAHATFAALGRAAARSSSSTCRSSCASATSTSPRRGWTRSAPPATRTPFTTLEDGRAGSTCSACKARSGGLQPATPSAANPCFRSRQALAVAG